MVVIGKPRVDSVEDFLHQNAIQETVADPGDTTDTASVASTSQTHQSSVQGLVITLRPQRKVRPQRYPRPDNVAPTRSSRQGMGVRKWRRYQNTVGLMAGIEEEENPEESFAEEIAEEGRSSFSELLEDPAKMQVWDKFTRLPEEQQRKFLMKIADDFDRASKDYDENSPRTAEDCFRRIDWHLRRLIAHRSPPVDVIEPMESELLEFFGEHPNDVMEVSKPEVYHRMIFHAICQYLGLLSKSVNRKETCNTQVRNRKRNGTFVHPPQRLSVYLAERFC